MQMFSYAYKHSVCPLCYNGDIVQAEDALRIQKMFPALPAMMLGRGILKNPGLSERIKKEMRFKEDGRSRTENPAEILTEKEYIRELERVREFHDRLYEAYCKAYLHVSGPKVVLFKMKEIWCYLASSFEDKGKAVKKIKKAQNLKEYEAAAALVFEAI